MILKDHNFLFDFYMNEPMVFSYLWTDFDCWYHFWKVIEIPIKWWKNIFKNCMRPKEILQKYSKNKIKIKIPLWNDHITNIFTLSPVTYIYCLSSRLYYGVQFKILRIKMYTFLYIFLILKILLAKICKLN